MYQDFFEPFPDAAVNISGRISPSWSGLFPLGQLRELEAWARGCGAAIALKSPPSSPFPAVPLGSPHLDGAGRPGGLGLRPRPVGAGGAAARASSCALCAPAAGPGRGGEPRHPPSGGPPPRPLRPPDGGQGVERQEGGGRQPWGGKCRAGDREMGKGVAPMGAGEGAG